ncbi:MAG TPA: ABC transporter substrate-binding protein [Opitutaceae bacterium]|nr:ABC transporter substrate-binding protein [Opitutaceae bacterium]
MNFSSLFTRGLWMGCSCLLAFLITGCGKKDASATASPTTGASPSLFKVTVQLDWVPEPEHGGFFQAQAKGFFKEAGVEVELLPGGPNAFVMQKVATGKADVAQADSTNVLMAISEGLPLIHIGAVFQNDPSVLMLHAENPVQRFEDLNGKTIMARPEWAFLPYLRKKYQIDFNIIPQNFSVANFVTNKDFIQQGFYIAEPFHILRGGGKQPKFLYAWDAGFDAYTVLMANKAWSEKNPNQVRAFMAAYIRGWEDYLTNDPTPAHTLMKQVNPNNTDDFMNYSRKMIIDEKLVTGRQGGGNSQIGRVSKERFQVQINQLEELKILPKGKITVDQVVTTAFLP